MNRALNFIIVTVAFLMATSILVKYSGIPFIYGSVVLFSLGTLSYIANVRLIAYYIGRHDPNMMQDGAWGNTAGLGVVPRWVSWLGLSSLPAFAAGILWLLTYYDVI